MASPRPEDSGGLAALERLTKLLEPGSRAATMLAKGIDEMKELRTAMANEGLALPHLMQVALAVLGLVFMRRARQTAPAPAPAPVVNVTTTSPEPTEKRPAPAKDTPAPKGTPQAA